MAPEENQINIVDPDTQELGSVPAEQLQDALAQGYSQASPEQVQQHFDQQKYGTLPQEALTGLEGGASAATLGASTALEKGLSFLGVPGLSDEDISKRREVNPGTHLAGSIAGLGATSIAGVGAIPLLETAGAAGVSALGLGAAEGLAARVGSRAVNQMIQFGLMQAGDEASKLMTSPNPEEGVGSALENIGISTLFGGALGAGFGAVSPLWKSASESKLAQTLKLITDKAGGAEVLTNPISEAIDQSGIQVTPEVKSALSNNPVLRDTANILRQSDTSSAGIQFQEAEKLFRSEASNQLLNAVGKAPEDLKAASDFSLADAGENIGKTAAKELHDVAGPLGEQFEALKEKYADVPLPEGEKIPEVKNLYGDVVSPESTLPSFADQLTDRVAQQAVQAGWTTMTDSEIMGAVNKVTKNLPKIKTLSQLSKFITQVGNETFDPLNPALSRAGMIMKGILKDGESEIVLRKLGEEGPELVTQHAALRTAWKEASELKDSLADKLKIKSGDSIGSFVKALKEEAETNGEKIANRLSGKGNADTLALMQEKFPQTAQLLKDFHQNHLLKGAVEKGIGGELEINSGRLLRSVSKMSPELKQFALGYEGLQKIEAVDTLLNQLHNSKHNFSNTARTLTSMLKHIPAGAGAMASMLLGHNPAVGLVLGELAQHLGKDVPDAARLALLKFLGTAKPIEAEGFKTAADFIAHMIAGNNSMTKAAKGVFKSGALVSPQLVLPSSNEKKKLDKQVTELQLKPEALMNVGGKLGHYMEPHAMGVAQHAAGAFQYLQGLKPNPSPRSPLDSKPQVPQSQKSAYDRALEVALHPLAVLKDVKNGTITPTDVQHLQGTHPALYRSLRQKLVGEMTDHLSEEGSIPYKTRMGLSLFLGQPLDSTLTPEGIMSAQQTFQQNASPTQKAPNARGGAGHSIKALGKLSEIERLPSQARQAERSRN